jgi:hypothetical protein
MGGPLFFETLLLKSARSLSDWKVSFHTLRTFMVQRSNQLIRRSLSQFLPA